MPPLRQIGKQGKPAAGNIHLRFTFRAEVDEIVSCNPIPKLFALSESDPVLRFVAYSLNFSDRPHDLGVRIQNVDLSEVGMPKACHHFVVKAVIMCGQGRVPNAVGREFKFLRFREVVRHRASDDECAHISPGSRIYT